MEYPFKSRPIGHTYKSELCRLSVTENHRTFHMSISDETNVSSLRGDDQAGERKTAGVCSAHPVSVSRAGIKQAPLVVCAQKRKEAAQKKKKEKERKKESGGKGGFVVVVVFSR